MSGIINKIGETLHIGGGNKDEHKPEAHKVAEHHGEYKDAHHDKDKAGEHKEGIIEKIKDKIHGGEGNEGEKHEGEKKKKKKEKKKHDDGHESSSSSDSD